MTEIIQSDGAIAENVINKSEAHPLPELYALVSRDLKNVAYSIANATDDQDAKEWAELLNNLSIGEHSFGALQGGAVESTLSTYMERHGFSAVPTRDATDWECEQLSKGNILEEMSGKTWWESPDHVQVPLSKDGEKLPVFVLSNETNEKTPTFSEAKEILGGVLERIPDVEVSDVLEDTETAVDAKNKDVTNSDEDDDSDRQSVNDPTRLDGVGPATVGKIEAGGFEIVPTLERHDQMEVEPFGFESDDASSDSRELLSSDVKERFMAVRDEMDELDEEMAKQRLIDGDLVDAVDTIEQYE